MKKKIDQHLHFYVVRKNKKPNQAVYHEVYLATVNQWLANRTSLFMAPTPRAPGIHLVLMSYQQSTQKTLNGTTSVKKGSMHSADV